MTSSAPGSGSPIARNPSSRSFGLSAPSIDGMAFCSELRNRTWRISRNACSNTLMSSLIATLVAPVGLKAGPGVIHAFQLDASDAVVLKTAEIYISLVLAHRRQRGVRYARRIPPGLQRFARLVEFKNAAMIKAGRQPLIGGHLLDHAEPKAGLAWSEIEGRGADAHQREPVGAIGCAIDVVGIARKLIDQNLRPSLFRSFRPVAEDLAQGRACGR